MSDSEKMDKKEKRSALGRGLSALLGDDAPTAAGTDAGNAGGTGARNLPTEKIRPNRYQPRQVFTSEDIDELVLSIKAQGVLQPILVRPHPDDPDAYELIAGERRWRASQIAQLHEIPAVIRSLTDQEALELALVENLQRKDLSIIEEAEGYQRLIDDFQHTQEDIAKAVGKSRSHVANTLRLLNLPTPVRAMVEEGRLSAGHARALLGSDHAVQLAEQVVAKGLNVRQTERLSQGGKSKGSGGSASGGGSKDADTLALERDLTNRLGLAVSINPRGQGGEIVVAYRSLEQLDDILARLSSDPDAYEDEDLFAKEELDEDEMRALLEEAEDEDSGEPALSELDLHLHKQDSEDAPSGALGQMGWKSGDTKVTVRASSGKKSEDIIRGSGWKNPEASA
ncbi:ParB/RepB/Spo0J family partition protein [Alphaproteobacteria bacterium HT1-32]|nr:ParB/RepB/Spo0J family partition protein [Alphaproteobacteria bacterium HT1-32]